MSKRVSVEVMERLLRIQPEGICKILSSIYGAVEDESIKLDCRRAVYAAKRMTVKLRANKKARELLKENLAASEKRLIDYKKLIEEKRGH